jgi:hypothetical protein
MAAESIEPPSDVNTVYKLAHQWVKTQTIQKGSSATTFVTSMDIAHANTDKKDHRVNVTKGKRDDSCEGPSKDRDKRDKKCYNCQQKGHYANKCPKKKQVALTQADNQDNNSGSAILLSIISGIYRHHTSRKYVWSRKVFLLVTFYLVPVLV